MNAIRTLLPALLALAPALHAQTTPFSEAQKKFDAAAALVRESVIKGQAVVDPMGDLQAAQALRDRFSEEVFPQACRARARLQLALEELVDRARRSQLRQSEIEQYVEEAVEERLDEELSALKQRIAEGTISPERFEVARQLIVRIAGLTLDQVHAQNVRVRLEAALDELRDAAARHVETAQQMHRLQMVLAQERVEHYLALIEQQVAAGRIHRIDYLLLQERVMERANLALGIPFDPCE